MAREKNQTQRTYLIPRPYNIVGTYLQEGRLRSGLTQRAVSQTLGYSSPQFISNFERGIALPPVVKLKALVTLYKLNSRDLVQLIIDCQRTVLSNELMIKKNS